MTSADEAWAPPQQSAAVAEQTPSNDAPPSMRVSAFVASLGIPGGGQFLSGHLRRGVIWFAIWSGVFVLLAVHMTHPFLPANIVVLAAGAGVVNLLALIDAVRIAKRPRWRIGPAWVRGLMAVAVYLTGAVVGLGLAFTWRFYVGEAFLVPTNNMMPAIIGASLEGTCTHCGESTPLTDPLPPDVNEQMRHVWGRPRTRAEEIANLPSDTPIAICTHCGQRIYPDAYPDKLVERTMDRVLVNKRITPRRWDIIAYQLPEDPTQTYLGRLVGLPGESVEIIDEYVWINGTALELPNDLRELRYPLPFLGSNRASGVEGRPARLANDEMFVLGDYAERSFDSRLWQLGAPGHPPHAVPVDHFIGVATEIYWPPERMQAISHGRD